MNTVRAPLRLTITVTSPSGVTFDLTDRIASLDKLSWALEDDLTALVHGDMNLEVRDADGAFEAYLTGFTPGQLWTVSVSRDMVNTSVRLFGGVLDLPGGVVIDRLTNIVEVQVLSYSKALDLADGTNVKRDLTGRVGTGTISTASLTMNTTADVVPGDVFEIRSALNAETVVVKTVDSGTAVTLVDNLTASYAAAPMVCTTPYYRNRTFTFLAAALLTEAGITDQTIDMTQDDNATPVPAPANDTGLPQVVGFSCVAQTGKIRVHMTSDAYEQDDPTSDFTDIGTASSGQADWSPYLTTEPGTIRSFPSNDRDSGTYGSVDYNTGDHWESVQDQDGVPGTDYLRLRQNGSNVATLDSNVLGFNYFDLFVEYDNVNNQVWCAWKSEDTTEQVDIYSGSVTTYLAAFACGGLRMCRQLSRMVVHNQTTNKLEFHTLGSGKAKDFEIDAPSGPIVWTFRVFDSNRFAAMCYRISNQLYLRVWDVATWDVVIDDLLMLSCNSDVFTTIWTDDAGVPAYMVLAYNSDAGVQTEDYFVVSRRLFGVVPYADFDGMSVARALAELCVVGTALFRINPDGAALVRARNKTPATIAATLPDDPLSWQERIVWEAYRAQIVVEGETEGGESFTRYVGDAGDSANGLSIDSKLVTVPVVATAIGQAYLAHLGVLRRQHDVEFAEDGVVVFPLDRVTWRGNAYIVMASDIDMEARRMSLLLVTANV